MNTKVAACVAWACALVACNGGGAMPTSSSKPCEVVVAADSLNLIGPMLERPYEGLPQTEPAHDVVHIGAAEPTGLYRYARSIVVYRRGEALRVVRDRYAHPQIIVYTDGTAPRQVEATLERFETVCHLAELKARHNKAATSLVARRWGLRVWVPADMSVCVDRPGFVWMAGETARATTGVCVFSLTDTHRVAEQTDSVLRVNLKGETDSMYMQLVRPTLRATTMPHGGVWIQGLWAMQGDAMGGPMAMRVVRRRGRTVAVMVFAYAPATAKRNLMVALKSVLYTIDSNT